VHRHAPKIWLPQAAESTYPTQATFFRQTGMAECGKLTAMNTLVSLTTAPHPTQPLCLDDQGIIRFKANLVMVKLLEKHTASLQDLLDSPQFSRPDKAQFVQLLGLPVEEVEQMGLVEPSELSQSNIQKYSRHPVEPLVYDQAGTLCFQANAIVKHLFDTGPLSDSDISMVEFFGNDLGQFCWLLGTPHTEAIDTDNVDRRAAKKSFEARQALYYQQRGQSLDEALPASHPKVQGPRF